MYRSRIEESNVKLEKARANGTYRDEEKYHAWRYKVLARDLETLAKVNWEVRAKAYRDRGEWDDDLGPKPGFPGSLCPQEVCVALGLVPATAEEQAALAAIHKKRREAREAEYAATAAREAAEREAEDKRVREVLKARGLV